MAQALARLRRVRASRGVMSAGLWPTLEASATYRRSYGSATAFGPSGAAESTVPLGTGKGELNFFPTGLDAAWQLDICGGKRRSIEAAAADAQAAEEILRRTQRFCWSILLDNQPIFLHKDNLR